MLKSTFSHLLKIQQLQYISKKFVYGFVVLVFVVVMLLVLADLCDLLNHILQGCFTGDGGIVRDKYNKTNISDESFYTILFFKNDKHIFCTQRQTVKHIFKNLSPQWFR